MTDSIEKIAFDILAIHYESPGSSHEEPQQPMNDRLISQIFMERGSPQLTQKKENALRNPSRNQENSFTVRQHV